MKIHRSTGYIHIDLSGAEAAWLLEELETVPKGSKFPKIKQVCEGLKQSLALNAAMAAPKTGRPKSAALVALPEKRVERMRGPFEIETTPPWEKDGPCED